MSLSQAKQLERLMNTQVRKWLGLPRFLSHTGLYGNGALSLPNSSLVKEYKTGDDTHQISGPCGKRSCSNPDYREKTDPSHCSAQCKICPPALIHTGPCPARQKGIWPWRNENYLKKSRKQNDDCGWERRCAGNEKLIDVPEPFPRASKAVG